MSFAASSAVSSPRPAAYASTAARNRASNSSTRSSLTSRYPRREVVVHPRNRVCHRRSRKTTHRIKQGRELFSRPQDDVTFVGHRDRKFGGRVTLDQGS